MSVNIQKITHMIETLYPIIQQEIQPEVRISALIALLEIERQNYNTQLMTDMIVKQMERAQ